MTDYIPSTESVKAHATEYNGLGMDEEDFDRWLKEHDRQVAEKAWDEGDLNGDFYSNPHRKPE